MAAGQFPVVSVSRYAHLPVPREPGAGATPVCPGSDVDSYPATIRSSPERLPRAVAEASRMRKEVTPTEQ